MKVRILLVLSVLLNILLGYHLHKARVINKAYWLWFYWNQGITINEASFYQDAVKWVNDPQYLPEE